MLLSANGTEQQSTVSEDGAVLADAAHAPCGFPTGPVRSTSASYRGCWSSSAVRSTGCAAAPRRPHAHPPRTHRAGERPSGGRTGRRPRAAPSRTARARRCPHRSAPAPAGSRAPHPHTGSGRLFNPRKSRSRLVPAALRWKSVHPPRSPDRLQRALAAHRNAPAGPRPDDCVRCGASWTAVGLGSAGRGAIHGAATPPRPAAGSAR